MTIATDYSLGKNERLKSRKRIGLLFDEGEVINLQPFRLLYRKMPTDGEPAPVQAGFAVSARNFRKATDRNRVKRLMKEAYRLNKARLTKELDGCKIHLDIFLIYVGRELPEWNALKPKMDQLTGKLINKLNEHSA